MVAGTILEDQGHSLPYHSERPPQLPEQESIANRAPLQTCPGGQKGDRKQSRDFLFGAIRAPTQPRFKGGSLAISPPIWKVYNLTTTGPHIVHIRGQEQDAYNTTCHSKKASSAQRIGAEATSTSRDVMSRESGRDVVWARSKNKVGF